MNKKSNFWDGVYIGKLILIILITAFISFTIMNFSYESFQNIPIINQSTQLMENYETGLNGYVIGIDLGIFLLAVIAPIISFYWARSIKVNAVGAIIGILALFLVIVVSMIFSNIYGAFLEHSPFQNFINLTYFVKLLLPNLPFWALFYSALVFFGLFSGKE